MRLWGGVSPRKESKNVTPALVVPGTYPPPLRLFSRMREGTKKIPPFSRFQEEGCTLVGGVTFAP